MLLRGKLPFLLKRLADSSSLNMQPPEPTCADSGGWLMPNKGSLFVSRQVFYLADDVLILALGLKVNRETNYGSDGSTYTTRPEQGVHQQVVVLLVNLVGEPSQPQNDARDSKE